MARGNDVCPWLYGISRAWLRGRLVTEMLPRHASLKAAGSYLIRLYSI